MLSFFVTFAIKVPYLTFIDKREREEMKRVNLSPFPLHFLILSPFLTARMPGCQDLCNPDVDAALAATVSVWKQPITKTVHQIFQEVYLQMRLDWYGSNRWGCLAIVTETAWQKFDKSIFTVHAGQHGGCWVSFRWLWYIHIIITHSTIGPVLSLAIFPWCPISFPICGAY